MTPENIVKNACLEWLRLFRPKGFFWRQNVGGMTAQYGNKKRFMRFGVPGLSDILGIMDGRFIAIECKAGKGKQSPAQAAFQWHVERCGGTYILAYSIDDLEKALCS